jgi:hypothetical protein
MADKYIFSIDEFMKKHSELDPALRPLIEPAIKDSEDQLFNFIMSYIFM